MKTWINAEMEELNIQATAGADVKGEDFDGTWVQINGKWYMPGADAPSGSESMGS